MTRESKIRMTVFAIICLIMNYFAVGYMIELYGIFDKNILIDMKDVEDVYIDGADFTPIFKMIGVSANIFVSVFMAGTYGVIIFVISLVLSILFNIIALSRKRQIAPEEYAIAKKIFAAALLISVLLGGLLSHFSLIIQLLIYNAIWSLWVFAFCIHPFKRIATGSDDIMTLRKGDK